MNIVSVTASRSYQVHIGRHLLDTLANCKTLFPKAEKATIISDSNVWPLYGHKVKENLEHAGLSVCEFIFPAGEESKNGSVYLDIVNHLAQQQLTRSDLLVALGGGVVGDITGFAAATYLRGISFIQVPTTLLAMVDSSVGGKTAIDLPAGKNLCGAFWQPSLVLCDMDTLDTLPEDVFRDGCAEVIKYSILYDHILFAHLEENVLNFDREAVITRCVELKRDVVAKDELDTGERMKLNLGHTIGHGIEARSNYALSHGKSVAIGIAIVSRASKCPDASRIISCLRKFGLPTTIDYPIEDMYNYILSDKKRSGSTVHLIIPRCIGCCDIVATPVEALKTFIKEGL